MPQVEITQTQSRKASDIIVNCPPGNASHPQIGVRVSALRCFLSLAMLFIHEMAYYILVNYD